MLNNEKSEYHIKKISKDALENKIQEQSKEVFLKLYNLAIDWFFLYLFLSILLLETLILFIIP